MTITVLLKITIKLLNLTLIIILLIIIGVLKNQILIIMVAQLKNYTKAIELKPDFSSAYFNRGEAKRVSGSGGSMGALEDFIGAYSLERR